MITGSNLGDREQMLATASMKLSEILGRHVAASKVYETEPWGFHSEHKFLNQVLLYEAEMEPGEILNHILQIEFDMGRKRSGEQFVSRSIDIDILFYNDYIISSHRLLIPHPRMHKRRFCLLPMLELDADFVHPLFGLSISELLDKCKDRLEVRPYISQSVPSI